MRLSVISNDVTYLLHTKHGKHKMAAPICVKTNFVLYLYRSHEILHGIDWNWVYFKEWQKIGCNNICATFEIKIICSEHYERKEIANNIHSVIIEWHRSKYKEWWLTTILN